VTAREEIAAAASTADGVDCSPLYRLVSNPGQAYVEWLRDDFPNKFGGESYYGVVVALPQDLAAAQAWIEEHKAALWVACAEAMEVTQVRPELVLQTDNPSQRVVVVEGHRGSGE
jgi:NADPH-dependent ferric siderophore reductase